MPGTLDLNNYFLNDPRRKPGRLGQSSVTGPGLRERIMQAQVAQERDRRNELMSQKLQGPVERAVKRAVMQTDFPALMSLRTKAHAEQFAAANPGSLTGRLMTRATTEAPAERLGRVGGGQFRGSEVAKQKMRKGLRRRLGG